jgi:hypothetical protein
MRTPWVAAGAAAAGLAGGLAAGARRGRHRPLLAPRRRVLGMPIQRKSGMLKTLELLGEAARQLDSAMDRLAGPSGEDAHEIREQLDKLNRRSPIEVVLDGLTHRRGVHRHDA